MLGRFRFSLRTVLVAITVFAVWLTILAQRAHHQRDSVARIEALGGTVYYDYQDVSRNRKVQWSGAERFDRSVRSPTSPWQRKLLGEDFFHDVVAVDLSQTEMSQAQIMELHASLPNAAIGSPRGPGYQNIWPSRRIHYDAFSFACALIWLVFVIWLTGQFVARRREFLLPRRHSEC